MKKYHQKSIYKKYHIRKWIDCFLIIIIVISLLGTIYYAFNLKNVFQKNKENNATLILLNENRNDNDLDWEITQVESLNQKIKKRKKELTNSSLDAQTKENLQKIIQHQELEKEALQNKIDFKLYLHDLEKEIQSINETLQTKIPLTEKHFLTEKKLKQEKELIYLKSKINLFQEKDELQQILLPGLQDKLKNANLTSNERNNLVQDKTRLENKMQDIKAEINKISQQIQVRNKIKDLETEIETEKDETLKQFLETEKKNAETKLEPWK